jgi:hypothetical protein
MLYMKVGFFKQLNLRCKFVWNVEYYKKILGQQPFSVK